jgi:hypothetical protein
MEQLISSADPAIAFIGFLQTMQALPERPLSQSLVFVSHRMADVPYAARIAWLARLQYWLDVHDHVLRLTSRGPSARPARLCHHRLRHHRDGTAELHARDRRIHAAPAEHVVATLAVESLRARPKAGSVIPGRWRAGFIPKSTHPSLG